MDQRVETALLACLERLETGRPVDASWVHRDFPGCEQEVLRFVDLQRCLERGRATVTHIGPYRILRRLGQGGMGSVFLAEDRRGRSVAVKALHRDGTDAPGGIERALAEARAGQAVRHPNVVRVLDCGIDGEGEFERVYLVFEAVSGQTLRGLLDDLGAVPEARAREIGVEVADALAAIHAVGLVHADVKPENVILGGDRSARLLDFGAVRGGTPSPGPADGLFVGSMLYAAPEQLGPGTEPIDGRADLFALGLVLYELVAGRHPFGRPRLPDDPSGSIAAPHHPRISPFLTSVLDGMLALDREDRPASAAQVRDVLREGEQSSWWRRRAAASSGGLRRRADATPLRGRERELAALECAVDAGRSVLVESEPGMGKSRILEELVRRRPATRARRVLRVSFAEGDPLAKSLRPHVAGRELPLDVRSIEVLEAYACASPIAVEAGRAELDEAVVGLLTAWSREKPVLVVADDLHLAPAEDRAIVARIVHLEEPTVSVIAAARPELPASWRDALLAPDDVSVLPLGPLGADAMRRLVTDLLGGAPSERLVAWCSDHSRGHPLLAREALRWMRETDGRLSDAGGVWDLVGDVEGVPLSAAVREVIRARLDRLDPPVRDVLDAAACGGLRFDAAELSRVLGSPVDALTERLHRIETEHGLLRSTGEGFAFDHQLVREVLHDDLYPTLRCQLHAAWAEALRPDADAIDGPLAVRLVSHEVEAGRGDEAAGMLETALAYQDAAVRPHAALGLLERVLAVLDESRFAARGPLLRQCAQRQLQLGRFEDLDRTLATAWAIAHHAEPLERAHLHDLNAKRALAAGKTDAVRGEVEKALALAAQAPEIPPALEASLVYDLARAEWAVGRAASAQDLFLRAAALAESAGDRELESHARALAASALAYAVSPRESFDACREADSFARVHGSALTRAIGRRTYGKALWRTGRSAESIEVFEEALDLCVRAGDVPAIPLIESDLSRVLANVGRFEEARARAESASRSASEVGTPAAIAYAEIGLGDLLMMLGDFDTAGAAFLRAARVLRRQGAPAVAECIARVAQARAAQGRLRIALGAYERASRGMYATQLRRLEAGFRIEFAEACLAAGRPDRARDLASAARRLVDGGREHGVEARATAIEAACAWVRDDPEAAYLTEYALRCVRGKSPQLRLVVLHTAAGGWMAERKPDDAAGLALRVLAETEDCVPAWLRIPTLALAARADRKAAAAAALLLRTHGQRLPLLDRIVAHAHVGLATCDEAQLAVARALIRDLDPVIDLELANPVIRRIAMLDGRD